VISQVYGGGGNSGATLKNDFIEIFNLSSAPISLNGYSVQYASATGNFSSSLLTPLPNTTLQPGHYFLIQEAAGAAGTVNLPTPDATGAINLSATTGKVALVNGTSAIAACTAANVVDLIGYGSGVSCSETSPAPGLSNTTANLRISGGCTDTDNNSTDFTAGSPSPRNTSTTANLCTGAPPPLTITTTSLPSGTINNVYSTTLSASGEINEAGGIGRQRTGVDGNKETIGEITADGILNPSGGLSFATISAVSEPASWLFAATLIIFLLLRRLGADRREKLESSKNL
jgi:hypothetical protein